MTGHPEAERVDPIAGDVRAVRRDSHERCGAGKIKAALECIASMFVGRVRQCFSVVWADGFPRCRHRFPVM